MVGPPYSEPSRYSGTRVGRGVVLTDRRVWLSARWGPARAREQRTPWPNTGPGVPTGPSTARSTHPTDIPLALWCFMPIGKVLFRRGRGRGQLRNILHALRALERDGLVHPFHPEPPIGREVPALFAVSCPSLTTCTAVGYEQTPYGYSTVAERLNGTAWTVQPTPNPAGQGLHRARGGRLRVHDQLHRCWKRRRGRLFLRLRRRDRAL